MWEETDSHKHIVIEKYCVKTARLCQGALRWKSARSLVLLSAKITRRLRACVFIYVCACADEAGSAQPSYGLTQAVWPYTVTVHLPIIALSPLPFIFGCIYEWLCARMLATMFRCKTKEFKWEITLEADLRCWSVAEIAILEIHVFFKTRLGHGMWNWHCKCMLLHMIFPSIHMYAPMKRHKSSVVCSVLFWMTLQG